MEETLTEVIEAVGDGRTTENRLAHMIVVGVVSAVTSSVATTMWHRRQIKKGPRPV